MRGITADGSRCDAMRYGVARPMGAMATHSLQHAHGLVPRSRRRGRAGPGRAGHWPAHRRGSRGQVAPTGPLVLSRLCRRGTDACRPSSGGGRWTRVPRQRPCRGLSGYVSFIVPLRAPKDMLLPPDHRAAVASRATNHHVAVITSGDAIDYHTHATNHFDIGSILIVAVTTSEVYKHWSPIVSEVKGNGKMKKDGIAGSDPPFHKVEDSFLRITGLGFSSKVEFLRELSQHRSAVEHQKQLNRSHALGHANTRQESSLSAKLAWCKKRIRLTGLLCFLTFFCHWPGTWKGLSLSSCADCFGLSDFVFLPLRHYRGELDPTSLTHKLFQIFWQFLMQVMAEENWHLKNWMS